KHFYEKLGLSNLDEHVYIDVIKANNNLVGFNLYKIYKGEFSKKPYYVIYFSLACIEKPYRGMRIMSLLSFRAPFALKEAYPSVEIYIFFDAIHPHSYRQAWNVLHYPRCRTENSLEFIKHITRRIYGEERASKYDGKNNFFWPTDAR